MLLSMVFVFAMATHDNDNFDPWTPLGLATAAILNRLHCQAQLLELTSEQKEAREEKAESENQAKEGPEHNREYVDGRLSGPAKMKGGSF